MASSHRIGVLELDQERLKVDLALVENAGFVDSYTEYVCGVWRTCMLRNGSGESADFQVHDYAGAPRTTEFGSRLGYLAELVDRHFAVDRLRFARLARSMPGSVNVPHRDYVDLAAPLVRIHVPLETAPQAYASEEQTVYRMGFGEVWFLDATRPHSIANFSRTPRTHLLLDFAAADPDEVVALPPAVNRTVPPDAVVPRRPLADGERDALLGLAAVVDRHTLTDALAILVKRYFVAELDVEDVFTLLAEIAAGSGEPDLVDRVRWLHDHALQSR